MPKQTQTPQPENTLTNTHCQKCGHPTLTHQTTKMHKPKNRKTPKPITHTTHLHPTPLTPHQQTQAVLHNQPLYLLTHDSHLTQHQPTNPLHAILQNPHLLTPNPQNTTPATIHTPHTCTWQPDTPPLELTPQPETNTRNTVCPTCNAQTITHTPTNTQIDPTPLTPTQQQAAQTAGTPLWLYTHQNPHQTLTPYTPTKQTLQHIQTHHHPNRLHPAYTYTLPEHNCQNPPTTANHKRLWPPWTPPGTTQPF